MTPPRRPWRNLARAVSWHRRKLAAVAAALAVLTGVTAAMPAAPPTVPAVVARAELRGGTVLGEGDLELRQVGAGDVPRGHLGSTDGIIGRTLAAPVAEGQVLTALALVSARASAGPGLVVAPLRLDDAGLATLLQPGDVVDVLAADEQAGQARVVARSVRLVTIPVVPDDGSADTAGALVLLAVSPSTATQLAQAAVTGPLTVTWR